MTNENELERTMRQASMTANLYLLEAIKSIDSIFEKEGFAKEHPELIAAFVKSCNDDYHSTMLYNILTRTNEKISDLSETINSKF